MRFIDLMGLDMESIYFMAKVFVALLITTILSGVIGYEREHIHRPAGIRTHILVGVSSTLVMLTSEFLLIKYQGTVPFDPTRMGAQVISGIGFLGAGTIIKSGYNVRGLTTAASLWSVACIGLACGSGFYFGAIFLTIVIYSTLFFLKKVLEKHMPVKRILIFSDSLELLPTKINQQLEERDVLVQQMEILAIPEETRKVLRLSIILPTNMKNIDNVLAMLQNIDGVVEAMCENQ